MTNHRLLIARTLRVALVSSLAISFVACDVDLAPESLHYRQGAQPFGQYEVLDSYASTPDAGKDSIVAAEEDIQQLPSSQPIYDANDDYADDPNSQAFLADVAEMFPNDAWVVGRYQASFGANDAQARAIMIALLCRPSYEKLASPIIRASISGLLTAGATNNQVIEAFDELSNGRIKLHFQPAGNQDGVVAVVHGPPVAAGTAIDVWVYGNVNSVTQQILVDSYASEGGDEGGDGDPPPSTGSDTAATTVDSTTVDSTTESTTVNTTTESSTLATTTESTTINTTTVNTTTGGGGGGTIDWAELLWDMFQGAGAGATLGGVVGTGMGNPVAGGAVGAAVGAAAGAAYYFGDGFMASPECDRASPFLIC